MNTNNSKETARRYNSNKIRYELIPNEFLKELAKVYTIGADKYSIKDENGKVVEDGADNWRKGLSWTDTIGSIQRHIQKFQNGEDYDYDYPQEYLDKYGPTLHLANAAWGLASLITYYGIHPELDDRNHKYLNRPKIGLDIDEVICDWMDQWALRYNIKTPKHWYFSYSTRNRLELTDELKEWYLNLPAKMNPDDLAFEPHCYITSRSIPIEITEQWIEKNGFPTVPIYCVPFGASKVQVAKDAGIDIFVDDKYENFVELNKAGICTFLLDNPHNQKYDVGYKRIKTLKELFDRFK